MQDGKVVNGEDNNDMLIKQVQVEHTVFHSPDIPNVVWWPYLTKGAAFYLEMK